MNFFNKKPQFQRPQPQRTNGEGCKIKVKYDGNGRIKELQDNGKCSKHDREAFLNNLGMKSGQSSDEEFD